MILQEITNGFLLTLKPAPLPQVLSDSILERWGIDDEDKTTVEELLNRAASISNACVFLRPAQVNATEGDSVLLGSHTFTSPLVAQKLHTCGMTVVGYVATCGRALHNARADYADDLVAGAVWDDICIAYLRMALDRMHTYVIQHIFPTQDGKKMYSSLNPGSLSAWPIKAQKDLFAFLGEGADMAGVELTPSMLMIPAKSSSGLLFPTDKPYENCMHCPRIDCPNRRAEYRGDE